MFYVQLLYILLLSILLAMSTCLKDILKCSCIFVTYDVESRFLVRVQIYTNYNIKKREKMTLTEADVINAISDVHS